MNNLRIDKIRNSAIELLQKQKNEVGELREIEYNGTLETSMQEIGKMYSSEINVFLEHKLSQDEGMVGYEFSKSCLAYLHDKTEELRVQDKPEIARGIDKYFSCLDSWAEGAGISPEEAFYMQFETMGCQTSMVRLEDGSVILGHIEQWKMEEKDKEKTSILPHWAKFQDKDKTRESYIGYTFSLPGSVIGVSNGVVSGVDSLYTDNLDSLGVPVSVANWLCWCLAGEVDSVEIISSLVPYIDGYALNEVQVVEGNKVLARTIEFAQDKVSVETLDSKPFEAMTKLNVASDAFEEIRTELTKEDREYFDGMEDTYKVIWKAWKDRYDRYKEIGREKELPELDIQTFVKVMGLLPGSNSIRSQIPQESDYINLIVKVSPGGEIDKKLVAGPILNSN